MMSSRFSATSVHDALPTPLTVARYFAPRLLEDAAADPTRDLALSASRGEEGEQRDSLSVVFVFGGTKEFAFGCFRFRGTEGFVFFRGGLAGSACFQLPILSLDSIFSENGCEVRKAGTVRSRRYASQQAAVDRLRALSPRRVGIRALALPAARQECRSLRARLACRGRGASEQVCVVLRMFPEMVTVSFANKLLCVVCFPPRSQLEFDCSLTSFPLDLRLEDQVWPLHTTAMTFDLPATGLFRFPALCPLARQLTPILRI